MVAVFVAGVVVAGAVVAGAVVVVVVVLEPDPVTGGGVEVGGGVGVEVGGGVGVELGGGVGVDLGGGGVVLGGAGGFGGTATIATTGAWNVGTAASTTAPLVAATVCAAAPFAAVLSTASPYSKMPPPGYVCDAFAACAPRSEPLGTRGAVGAPAFDAPAVTVSKRAAAGR